MMTGMEVDSNDDSSGSDSSSTACAADLVILAPYHVVSEVHQGARPILDGVLQALDKLRLQGACFSLI